jgi:hypothetical protein
MQPGGTRRARHCFAIVSARFIGQARLAFAVKTHSLRGSGSLKRATLVPARPKPGIMPKTRDKFRVSQK